ncbi:dioxygenase family protein [Brucella intermedia]|uniref:dioxygenase family protein n=1 Tax=Brucella intermedia TaxID=94625 RepID=UPI00224AA542|nr:dioxygenase [Brucella intermedia]
MPDSDKFTITQAVRDRLLGAQDPRILQISDALVRHLHAFLREIEPTEKEWLAGIEFLTAVGQTCDDKRQEFILLSDTLGASMLVDAINHQAGGRVTETTVLGPFYLDNAAIHPAGTDIATGHSGEPMLVELRVVDPEGQPVAGAIIDTWHADADGYYDVQREEDEHAMRARFLTDADGRTWFRSVVPAAYPIPDDGPVGHMLEAQGRHPYRPAHVHFKVIAEGHKTLVTHLFREGDMYLGSDAVFGVKQSLIVPFVRKPADAAPLHAPMNGDWYHLVYEVVLLPADHDTRIST